MMTVTWPARMLIACAILAACGQAMPSRTTALNTNAALRLPRTFSPDHAKSWVSRDAARTTKLLFISDLGTSDVDIFALPDMTLKGKLTGFREPLGECSDNHGNVWIANYLAHELVEYSHSGSRIGKIKASYLNPSGCAVSPANGDIAIMEQNGPLYAPGDVLVYASPSARPVILRNPVQYYYFYGAYNDAGELWEDGTDALSHSLVSKCGKSKCSTVFLSGGSIFSAGAIAWDAVSRKWVIFDQYCHESPTTSCSYPVSTRGIIGTPTTYSNHLGSSPCVLIQPTLATSGDKSIVLGADNQFQCGNYYSSTVDRWNYPAGGVPTNYKGGDVIYPWGAAVSNK